MFFNGKEFSIKVSLHPNQKWLVLDDGDDYLYLDKGSFSIKMAREDVTKYFREVEE